MLEKLVYSWSYKSHKPQSQISCIASLSATCMRFADSLVPLARLSSTRKKMRFVAKSGPCFDTNCCTNTNAKPSLWIMSMPNKNKKWNCCSKNKPKHQNKSHSGFTWFNDMPVSTGRDKNFFVNLRRNTRRLQQKPLLAVGENSYT